MSRLHTIKLFACGAVLLGCIQPTYAASAAQAPQDNDQTLRAMRDEMARSKTRLRAEYSRPQQPVRPYYVEYRLLDLDIREVVAEFGTLLTRPGA